MNHQAYSEKAVLLLHFPEAGLLRTKMWPVMATCDSAQKEIKEDDPMAISIYTPPDTEYSYIFSQIMVGGIYTIGDKCTGTTKQNPSSPKAHKSKRQKNGKSAGRKSHLLTCTAAAAAAGRESWSLERLRPCR